MRDTYLFYEDTIITAGLSNARTSKGFDDIFTAGWTWPSGLETNFTDMISKNKLIKSWMDGENDYRSCNCSDCSKKDEIQEQPEILFCSKSCFSESKFENLFVKLRSCKGICEEISKDERHEIIRIVDDRNKCSPLKTKVTCQDYLKVKLIDWIHWTINREWNQEQFSKYQKREHDKVSKDPLRFTQDWHDMIIWGRTQNWYTWPEAEITWRPGGSEGEIGSKMPMDDKSLLLFVRFNLFLFITI